MGTGIIRETCSNLWENTKEFFGISSERVSRDVGSSQAFEIEKANARRIQKMSEDLLEYSKKYTVKSGELEQNVSEKINSNLDTIINSLAEIENIRIDGKKLRVNLKSLKQEMRRFEKDNKHNFINSIHKALSLDNKECLEVLKLESGAEKEKEMKKFLGKILNNELKKLSYLSKDILKENLNFIAENLEDKVIELEETINEQIGNFEKLEKAREIGIKERDNLLKNKIIEKIMYKGMLNE
ncbi:MAG: hypothetical protein ACRCZR_09660 [Cetobacterium sp.]